jgi:hypothetical protein
MGNVVCSGALLSNAPVNHYVLLQAAVPAACFDRNSILQQEPQTRTYPIGSVNLWSARTPDDDEGAITRSLAYRGRLIATAVDAISFYLPEDRATVYAWEFNNAFKPDNGFFYSRNEVDGQRLWKNESGIRRSLADPYEAMPYADQAWSKCAGAESRTGGVIARSIDLNASFRFKDNHSAEFEGSIQALQPFYSDLLNVIGSQQSNP